MWLLLALALALVGCRDPGGSGKPAPAPPPAVADAAGGAAGDRIGVGPQLAVADAAPVVDAAPIGAFADEVRDEAWAHATELRLAAQLKGLPGVDDVKIECRTAQCRVTIGTQNGRATDAAGELESTLRDQATSVVFDAPSDPDRVVAYAQFRR